jgi:hypothetical protein
VPALRTATVAVFLLLVSVTAADLAIDRDSDQADFQPQVQQTVPAARQTQSEPTELPDGAPVAGEDAAPEPLDDAAPADGVAPAAAPTFGSEAESSSLQQAAPAEEPALAMERVVESPAASPAATPAAKPVPTAIESAPSGNGISRWRIAEIGLLLLLAWLLVTWIGRARIASRDSER